MVRPRKPVIAVVDDERAVLESLADLLESDGYSARLFGSAKEFLDSGALSSVDCLISDIRMPVMDGWGLEAEAARARPDLAVILITAHDATRAAAARQRLVLRKPFDGLELLAAVRAAVGG